MKISVFLAEEAFALQGVCVLVEVKVSDIARALIANIQTVSYQDSLQHFVILQNSRSGAVKDSQVFQICIVLV